MAVVIIASVAFALRSKWPGASVSIGDAISVAPFNVLVPELSLWKEGLVDVLSRSLDGMGPIRTVAPSASIRAWAGRADPEGAAALARATGARLVLFGTLQPGGRDSVRAVATVFDAMLGKVLSDIEARDELGRMDRLADSLTVRFVRFLASDRRLALTPRASAIGSRSITAMKEFLQAEQFQRSALFDSAAAHYRRAAELDSTFALAHWGLANSTTWRRHTEDDVRGFLRAGALNSGLGPRDSLLILFDSIATGRESSAGDPVGGEDQATVQRMYGLLGTLTRLYPDFAPGWYRLGESRFHVLARASQPPTLEQMAEAFDSAIAGDSGYSEAYVHAIQIANAHGRRELAARYAGSLATRARGSAAEAAAWTQWFLSPAGHTDAELQRLADTVTRPEWYVGFNLLLGTRLVDSAATTARFLRLLSTARRQFPGVPGNADLAGSAARAFEFHGQLRNARALASSPGMPDAAALARLGVLDADSVAAALRAGTAVAADSLARAARLVPFWLWRGDTAAVIGFRQRLAARPPPSVAEERRVHRYDLSIAEAYVALVRRNTREAMRQLDSLPTLLIGSVWDSYWSWLIAPPLAEQGRQVEALRLSRTPISSLLFSVNSAEDAEHLFTVARIAERAGEREQAAKYYEALAVIWVDADPEYDRLRAEIHSALGRLSRDRSGRPVGRP